MDDNKSVFSNPFDDDDMKPIEDDSSGHTFVWLILGVVAIGCGLVFAAAFFFFKPDAQALAGKYFPSSTATFTQTPTVTPSITPSPTSTATPTPNMTATAAVLQATDTAAAYQATAVNAASIGRVILKDTFDSNKNGWVVKQSDDEYGSTNYKIADGAYIWDATAHQAFIGWVTADPKAVSDFYLTVEVKQSAGPDSADYGVIFREDDNSNFYYFGIDDQGQYVLYLYNNDWITLIDWTESELIQPGESNRITILGEGSHFIFFINDQYLTEVTDDSLASGTVALAIELAGVDDNAVFQFDNFELRVPK